MKVRFGLRVNQLKKLRVSLAKCAAEMVSSDISRWIQSKRRRSDRDERGGDLAEKIRRRPNPRRCHRWSSLELETEHHSTK
jgi:hypothetical protein